MNIAVAVGVSLIWPWNPITIPAGQFLIDTDAPIKSDLIYLLGGNWLSRGPVAASLFAAGYAPIIVFARLPGNECQLTLDVLTKTGVPKKSIVDLDRGRPVNSTADEARALRAYVDTHPTRTVLVVTSVLHSRRARMAMNRSLSGTGVQVRVICDGDPHYIGDRVRDVELEWTKLLYYFFTFYG